MLKHILEAESGLERILSSLEFLQAHIPTLEIGSLEWTGMQNDVAELQYEYIEQLYAVTMQKAKFGIVGKTWYKGE